MTTATAPMTQTFTILAADKLAQQGLDWIESQSDAALLNRPDLVALKKDKGQDVVDEEVGKLLAAGGVHAMVVRSGIKVTAKMLENPGDLKIIARAGVGVDNIDLQAAKIQTLGERVEDVFFITAQYGNAIVDDDVADLIQKTIREELDDEAAA